MLLFLYLAIILGLSASGIVRGDEEADSHRDSPLQDIRKKVNDLWQNLLYPQLISKETEWTGYATCEVKPSSNLDANKPQVTGQVLFRQSYPNGKLEVIFDLDGFPLHSNQSGRAIHIHELGDLSKGCDSAAGHYNPFKVNHPHHPGDFGNFLSKGGKIRKYKGNLLATLFGPYSIIGRSIVIHEQEDDMGKGGNKASLENGNAGRRLACCVIGICNKNSWEKNLPDITERRKRRITNEHKTTRPN
ncbi:extracellular superoxide dismutase [Cu-Zn] [Pelodiscus sinensis]|uniref:Superoxide dismutase [Cu-Zn] n=1 Tax=Pelodiscus sinensis TaxID=13735 RepID=K7G722_PELSI|nr:extracellular superoxide dismutase [Cu-Zn] [Pelodiscus sinensis]|eukprot:XP_006138225.1 extracellular superoxide dismutase [Cu-Zn] [Pelodiscus sinensis]